MIRILFVVMIALMLAGCASSGTEAIQNRPADWPPMTMTKQELIAALGPPMTSTTVLSQDGTTTEQLGWAHATAETDPALYIPIVGLFVAASGNGIHGQSKAFTAVFDRSGKMISKSWSQQQIGKPTGNGANPAIGHGEATNN